MLCFCCHFLLKNNHRHDPSDNVLGSVCLICLFFFVFLVDRWVHKYPQWPHYVLLLHCRRFAPICAGSKNGFCCSFFGKQTQELNHGYSISLRSRLSTISLVERSMQNVLMGCVYDMTCVDGLWTFATCVDYLLCLCVPCQFAEQRTFTFAKPFDIVGDQAVQRSERADCASSTALVYVQILVTHPKMFHRKINCTELVAWQIRIQWLYKYISQQNPISWFASVNFIKFHHVTA